MVTSAQPACCAVRCSMDAIVYGSIAGGHSKSTPHSSLLWWDDKILAFPTPPRSYTHSSRLLRSLFNEGKKYARFCPSSFPSAGALAASKRHVFLLHHGQTTRKDHMHTQFASSPIFALFSSSSTKRLQLCGRAVRRQQTVSQVPALVGFAR